MKGVLIECDPAMKQFLLHLDEKVNCHFIVVQPGVLKLKTFIRQYYWFYQL